ncbi:MAG: peptidase MA family metallohydrolase [Acidobacteriota bacterium]
MRRGSGAGRAVVGGAALCVFMAAAAGTERLSVKVGACRLEALPEQRVHLQALAERAAVVLPRVERELAAHPAAPYRIVLIPGGPVRDPEIARLDSAAPRWAAGFLMPERRVGAIRIARADRYPYSDLASVLVHEAVHMILHDAAGREFPRWFGEGVATVLERAWGLRDVVVYSSSLLTGRLPTLGEMDEAFASGGARARTAYAASFDFVMWTVRRHGPDSLGAIIQETSRASFTEAWRMVTGEPLARSESRWRRGSLILYRWVPALTGTGTLWIAITLLVFLAAARRRARSREILERWEREGDFGQEW